MNELTRRVFLGVTLVGGAAAAVGAAVVLREPEPGDTGGDAGAPRPEPIQQDSPATAAITGQLRRDLGYLTLSAEVLASFAADHLRAQKRKRKHETNGLTEQFLLSTDFFSTGADEGRPPKYVAYFDPYMSPCYDPMKA